MKLSLQFIVHPGSRERLVVIPESQFRVLEKAAAERHSGQKGGEGTPSLPRDVLDAMAKGENPVRAVRLWRGLSGRQLAELVGVSASMLSQIERTGKTGSTKTFKAIACILDVPLDLIFPNYIEEP